MEAHQSFPKGWVDSPVGKSSQSEESRSLVPVQKIKSSGSQLFDEQPIVCQPQPGEQFQVGDHLVSSVRSDTIGRPPTVGRHGCPSCYSAKNEKTLEQKSL